jgi:hypothetical protein
MNYLKKFATVALGLLLGAAMPASGTAVLQLIDNEGHFAQVTGTASTLMLSVNNTSGNFAGSPWSLAIAVGTNGVGAFGVPAIDFDLTATAARAGSLTAVYSIDNLTYGSGLHSISVNSLINSPYTSGILWEICVDDGNVLTAQSICTGYSSAVDGLLGLPSVAVDGLFSLTIIGRLVDTTSSRLVVNAAAAVPEPGTLLLLGIALLLGGALKNRKFE